MLEPQNPAGGKQADKATEPRTRSPMCKTRGTPEQGRSQRETPRPKGPPAACSALKFPGAGDPSSSSLSPFARERLWLPTHAGANVVSQEQVSLRQLCTFAAAGTRVLNIIQGGNVDRPSPAPAGPPPPTQLDGPGHLPDGRGGSCGCSGPEAPPRLPTSAGAPGK